MIGAILMKELIKIFLLFCKIGVTTFGGGYAMLPVIQRELVEKRGLATNEEIMNYYAIGQCTPGVIAVNTATFIGKKQKGIPGAIAATLGVVFPSVLVIIAIAAFIENFAEMEAVKHAFAGIRVAVCALVFNAVVKLFKSGIKDAAGTILFAAAFFLSITLDVSPVFFVVCSAAAGIILKSLKRGCGK